MPTPLFLPRRAPEASNAPPPRRFSGAAARGREAAALLLAAASAFAALALASFEAHPGRPEARGPDWVGPVGASLAGALVGTIGVIAWALVLEFALLAWPLLRGRASRATLARLAGDVVILLIAAALVHVSAPDARAFGELAAGGAVGELFGELLRSLFSTLGSFLVGLTAVGLILIGRSSLSLTAWLEETRLFATHAARLLVTGWLALVALIRRWTAAMPVEVAAPATEGGADLGPVPWSRDDSWGRDASTPPSPSAQNGFPDAGGPPPAKAPPDPATSAPPRRGRARARTDEPDAPPAASVAAVAPVAPVASVASVATSAAPALSVATVARSRNASRAALTPPEADEARADNDRPQVVPVIHGGGAFVAPVSVSVAPRTSAAESNATRTSATESNAARTSATESNAARTSAAESNAARASCPRALPPKGEPCPPSFPRFTPRRTFPRLPPLCPANRPP